MGRLDGDCLQCGYHGVTYAADGQCVRIPGSDEILEQAKAVPAATLALAAPPLNPARLVAEPAYAFDQRIAWSSGVRARPQSASREWLCLLPQTRPVPPPCSRHPPEQATKSGATRRLPQEVAG